MKRAFAAIVFATVLAAAAVNTPGRVGAAVAGGPPQLFPPDLLRSAQEADRRLPPGAALFYVSADTDTWTCGLWQRALYPRAVFCLRTVNPHHEEIFRQLRGQFDIHYAVGSTEPLPETVLRSRDNLSETTWIGELEP